jgi:hypothetical protein
VDVEQRRRRQEREVDREQHRVGMVGDHRRAEEDEEDVEDGRGQEDGQDKG